MEWLAEYWPQVAVGVLILLLVLRLAVGLLRFRSAPKHTGEQTIRVLGVGGAGGNALNEMIGFRDGGVDYLAINTDGQVLEQSLADRRIRIGDQVTKGLGAGGDAALGRQAAEEDAESLRAAVAGASLVFVAAGLGGGTGSGAAPVLASHAREAGALTIAVVTMPFAFEGPTRQGVAEAALAELRPNVDTLLVIENDRVMGLVEDDTTLSGAFRYINDVLAQTVRAVVDIMAKPGLVNLDFADVCAIMRDGGAGLVGIGHASGADRAVEAARKAIASPLLAVDLHGARAILLPVAGARQLALRDVVRAAETVREAADPEANLIFGATFDDHLKDEVRVTVIATRLRQPGGTPPSTDHGVAADRSGSPDAASVLPSRSGRRAPA